MPNHCLHSSMCQVLCIFVLTYLTKQFVKTDTRHKNLTLALDKKDASREFSSFQVLMIQFIKENVEHSQNERVKKMLSTNLRRRNFVVDLWY